MVTVNDNSMNEVNENVIEVCIESIAAQVADVYAEKQNISVTDAMRKFMLFYVISTTASHGLSSPS